jgi:hypothetical protein
VVEKGLTKKTVITESVAFEYSVKNTILVETKKGVIRVAAAMLILLCKHLAISL